MYVYIRTVCAHQEHVYKEHVYQERVYVCVSGVWVCVYVRMYVCMCVYVYVCLCLYQEHVYIRSMCISGACVYQEHVCMYV